MKTAIKILGIATAVTSTVFLGICMWRVGVNRHRFTRAGFPRY